MTTGKTIALSRWTFVGKVMALLFNILLDSVCWYFVKNVLLCLSVILAVVFFWGGIYRNRPTDIENKLMVLKRKEQKGVWIN